MFHEMTEETKELSPDERNWCYFLYNYFLETHEITTAGNILKWLKLKTEVLRKNLTDLLDARFRKVIRVIRTGILIKQAKTIMIYRYYEDIPKSYRKIFWISASRKGYISTDSLEEMARHRESLVGRRDSVNHDIKCLDQIVNAKLYLDALKAVHDKKIHSDQQITIKGF